MRDADVPGVQTCALPTYVDLALRGDAEPVHQPDVVLARQGVAPQDVGPAVAVEVPHPLDLPRRIGHRGAVALGGARKPVHQPNVVMAGSDVPPHDGDVTSADYFQWRVSI